MPHLQQCGVTSSVDEVVGDIGQQAAGQHHVAAHVHGHLGAEYGQCALAQQEIGDGDGAGSPGERRDRR